MEIEREKGEEKDKEIGTIEIEVEIEIEIGEGTVMTGVDQGRIARARRWITQSLFPVMIEW